jgi:hypothetical protein
MNGISSVVPFEEAFPETLPWADTTVLLFPKRSTRQRWLLTKQRFHCFHTLQQTSLICYWDARFSWLLLPILLPPSSGSVHRYPEGTKFGSEGKADQRYSRSWLCHSSGFPPRRPGFEPGTLCEICGTQSGTTAGFPRVLQFPLPILIPPTAAHSSGSGTTGQ